VIFLAMLAISGAPVRWIAGMLGCGVFAVLCVGWFDLLQPYQLARVTTLMDPTADPQGRGYNANQAIIAVGSGGFEGTGLFQGEQTSGRFVPEQHTDFVFTVAAEELGFIGGVLIIALVTLVIWRVLRVAAGCEQPYARLERRHFDVKGSVEQILTPDKENAMYIAATALRVRDDDPDHPAIVLGDFVLGAGSLSSRLGDRIRQREGLAYGVGSHYQALPLDRRASFLIYASANPENMDRLKKAIDEEVARLLEKGVTEDELALAKQGYLQRQQVGRTNDRSLAAVLAQTLEADRTMEYHADLERKIEALTPDEVVAALRKHFDPEKLAVALAGDFERTERAGGNER
jgi:hypothetical protein